MAAWTIRGPWVRGILALVNAVVLVWAASLVASPSPGKAATLAQLGDPLPPGAAACGVIYPEITAPFNAGARGTPLTSCPFVEQVRRTAHTDRLSTASPSTQLRVVSPTTRSAYEMQCISAKSYVTCTGGEDAVVYLYNARP
jgi:hypothetical protein